MPHLCPGSRPGRGGCFIPAWHRMGIRGLAWLGARAGGSCNGCWRRSWAASSCWVASSWRCAWAAWVGPRPSSFPARPAGRPCGRKTRGTRGGSCPRRWGGRRSRWPCPSSARRARSASWCWASRRPWATRSRPWAIRVPWRPCSRRGSPTAASRSSTPPSRPSTPMSSATSPGTLPRSGPTPGSCTWATTRSRARSGRGRCLATPSRRAASCGWGWPCDARAWGRPWDSSPTAWPGAATPQSPGAGSKCSWNARSLWATRASPSSARASRTTSRTSSRPGARRGRG